MKELQPNNTNSTLNQNAVATSHEVNLSSIDSSTILTTDYKRYTNYEHAQDN
jgi:hypothetical protein